MHFRIYGADRETGEDRSIEIECPSAEHALEQANKAGMLVNAVERIESRPVISRADNPPASAIGPHAQAMSTVRAPEGFMRKVIAHTSTRSIDNPKMAFMPTSTGSKETKRRLTWLSPKRLAVALFIPLALLASAALFVNAFGRKANVPQSFSLEVTAKMRDPQSKLLVPVHGAYVFVVPVGDSVDSTLSEYASLAKNNIDAGAEAFLEIQSINHEAEALAAEAKLAATEASATSDSGFNDANLSALEQFLDRREHLMKIQKEMDGESAKFDKLSAQVLQLRQELAALQKQYREKAIRADRSFRRTDSTGQAKVSGIKSRSVVIYVMPDDSDAVMLFVRKVDAASVLSAVLGPADDVLPAD